MSQYVFSFLWGICILLSFIGWGGIINRVFFPKQGVDWGQKAAWGIAFSIFIGGMLNLAWLISRTTLLIYLGAGFLCWLLHIFLVRHSIINPLHNYIRNFREDKLVAVGVLVIFSLVLVQYGGLVFTKHFNSHDDFQAYFVFPNKMLQTGSMGPDPFSERRIVSSLGGQVFLQTFVLSACSERNLNIVDPGLGAITVIGLLLGYFRNKNIPKRVAVFTLIFFLFTPQPKANVTATVIPTALFISIFRTLDWEELRTNRLIANASIIALLAAAICSLKSTLIPACGILLVASYIFHIVRSQIKGRAVYEAFLAMVLTGLFLLPWMIAMYQSSGTLLYPLLGKGYHGSVYGTFLTPTSGLAISKATVGFAYHFLRPYVISLVLLSIITFRSSRARPAARGAYESISIGAILGTIIVVIATGGIAERYYFSFVSAAVTILLAAVLSDSEIRNGDRVAGYTSKCIAMSLAFIMIGNSWDSFQERYRKFTQDIKAGISNIPMISDKEFLQYSKMQSSIPPGEVLLERLAKPFLLDFRRNTIFIADYPGGASMPPGMPFFKGPDALADYLISKSIRYVAYSYASEAEFRFKDYESRLRYTSSWVATEAKHTFDFQNNLEQLGKTRKRVYDDGDIFVLDLLSRVDKK
jgi:hypothetical protein